MNVADLDGMFDANEEVTPQVLKERGLVKQRYDELKILGDGELTKALKVSAHRFSKSAQEKIEKAGGSVTVVKRITTVAEKKEQAKKAGVA